MANIVITHFSPFLYNKAYQSCVFYDGLIKGFTEEGHNILQIITSDFLKRAWNGSNQPFSNKAKYKVLNKIKSYKPDLIISFNNSSISGIEEIVDCPIALWNADNFEFFNDKNCIKKNPDRYHYMSFLEYGIKNYKDNLNIKEHQVCRVPGATAVRNKNEEKKYNISFIGHPFFKSDNLVQLLNDHPELIDISETEIDKNNEKISKLLRENNVKDFELKYHKTSDIRTQLITNLLPLKPTVFGPPAWLRLATLSCNYIGIYNSKTVLNLDDNEKVYNQSQISISTNHAQNKEGYPWRIHDILASSSVLLSEYRHELKNDFSKIKNLQLFNSPSEAYDMAKYLLENKSYRTDIINQQNEIIDESYRWKHRLPLIQQLTNVDLINTPNKLGTHELFRLKNRLPSARNTRHKRIIKCFLKELGLKKKKLKTNNF